MLRSVCIGRTRLRVASRWPAFLVVPEGPDPTRPYPTLNRLLEANEVAQKAGDAHAEVRIALGMLLRVNPPSFTTPGRKE